MLVLSVLGLASCASADVELDPGLEQGASHTTVVLPLTGSTDPGTVVGVEPGDAEQAAIPVQSGASLDTVQRERRAEAAAAQPVAIAIRALDIDAVVRPVGVEDNGEMEIPGAAEVGWYRYGSRPGDEGSAVLAAHVDYDGQVGVFFDLGKAEAGDTIDIAFSDDTVRSFVVLERSQFEKQSLPFDEIFRRDGDPSLVLITCGGDFNPSLRSYEANVVLFAEPLAR
jgi:sortase (surface protein transpeptidase)